MARKVLDDGVMLEFDERVFTVDRSNAAPAGGRRRAPPSGTSKYDDSPRRDPACSAASADAGAALP